ncbi:MAG: Ig-like domain-containing protein [Bacilli bacterium]|nr:Ig-like domain-containing protein [Bacilli bacterium]
MKKRVVLENLFLSLFLVGCSRGSVTPVETSSQESASVVSSIDASSVSSINAPSVSSEETSEPASSEERSSASSEAYVAVSSVSLDQSSLELFTDDSSVSLLATVLPENATNKALTWDSSDTSVAMVEEGNVMPIGAGNAVITVKTVDGTKSAECAVTVREPPIAIPNYVLHGLFYGESEWTDKAMVNNPYSTSEYMIQGVALHADDVFKIHMFGDAWYGYSALKTSTKAGLVTAAPSDDNIKVLTTGIYDIYCDYNESDGGHIYIGRVDETTPTPSVVSVSGISLSNAGKYLLTRNEFTISATVYPDNASNKEVSWTSSDTSIATVTRAGRVVAKEKKGITTITAKTSDGGFTATCLVYVSASQYPDYCLTGTVGGQTYSYLNLKYAAIPLSTGRFLIPDVNLVAGDEVTVMDNRGGRLRDKSNQVYKKTVRENMSVHAYLNVNDPNKDYLSFEAKAGN